LGRESLQAVLEPTEKKRVKHFTWTGAEDAPLIVHTKPNPGEAIL
jgi:hypothetical protein